MEGLQFAQVLADLSQLQTAEPSAALGFLQSSKRITEWSVRRKSQANLLPTEQPQYDRLGRRITTPAVQTHTIAAGPGQGSDVPSGATATSASDKSSTDKGLYMATRNNSAVAPPSKAMTSSSAHSSASNSGASTPALGIDTEIERAKALMQLYEIRGKLKQQENAGLTKATERVQAVAARYTKLVEEQRQKEQAEKRKAQTQAKGSRFLSV